jgi:sec-independent protein translocase protein TatA
MPTLGAPELIIILVIIILIFGVGKLPEVGQALGKGIREFRGAAETGEEEPETPAAAPARPAAPAPVAVEAPRPSPVVVEAPRPSPVVVEAPRPAPVQTVVSAATAAYIVVSGDTPEAIARSHGVTVEELLSANGWSQKDRVLYEGDRIQIPAKHTA